MLLFMEAAVDALAGIISSKQTILFQGQISTAFERKCMFVSKAASDFVAEYKTILKK